MQQNRLFRRVEGGGDPEVRMAAVGAVALWLTVPNPALALAGSGPGCLLPVAGIAVVRPSGRSFAPLGHRHANGRRCPPCRRSGALQRHKALMQINPALGD
jgi:hypothetical protein